MRLTPSDVETIRSTVREVAGEGARVTLFGSRVNDAARGGDVDLLVELPGDVDEPAVLMARLASRLSRSMGGRNVDVALKAPNLMAQPIHQLAEQSGVVL